MLARMANSMRVSGKGFAEILFHEAIVTRRYKDSVGVWTFGVGHTKAAGAPDPIKVTADQPVNDIIVLFRADLRKYEDRVNQAVTYPISQTEFDALVSFDFNTGAITRASFVKKLNGGDFSAAAKGMAAYNKPASIKARRATEVSLFQNGVYSGDGTVMVYPASDRGAVLWAKGRRMKIGDLVTPAAPDLDKDIGAKLQADQRIKDVQQSLADFGYTPGAIDGKMGPLTVGALAAYRHDRGLAVTDTVDAALISDMQAADDKGWSRPIPEERATATHAEIAKKSRTMHVSWWGKIAAAVGLGGGTAGNAIKDSLLDPDQIDARLSVGQRLIHFATDNWILLLGVVIAGAGTWGAFKLINRLKVADYREGRRA